MKPAVKNIFAHVLQQSVWQPKFLTLKKKYSKQMPLILDCFRFTTHPVLAKLVHILTSCDLTVSSGVPSNSTSKCGEKIKYPSSSA